MQEVLVIALIILLLFGGKKIPELMKGLGKGVKSFKDGMNGLDDAPADGTTDARTRADGSERNGNDRSQKDGKPEQK